MAIQITEDKLSQKAKKALNNAKNKSQFMRDALEYYVNREEFISEKDSNSNSEHVQYFKKEIQELKELIQELHIQPNNGTEEKQQFIQDGVESQDKIFDSEKSAVQSDKVNRNIQDNSDELPDEEKKRIEKMISDSLNMFG